MLVDLLPGNDVEFSHLPPELDGVISAAILPGNPKITYFLRRNGQLWLRKDTNERWFREASFVRKVLCTYHPYAITEAGDLIRPTYTNRREWKVHAAGPWIDVEPGMSALVGINQERKLVPIPGFDDVPEKNSGLFQLPDFEDVRQVSLGTGSGMVMDQEGNWREWTWGNLKGLSNPDYLLKMKSVGAGGSTDLAITHDGKVVMYRIRGSDEVRRQMESIRDAEAIFTASGAQSAFAIRLQGNRWRLLIGGDEQNSLQLVDPSITDALTGCREVVLTKEVAVGLRDLPEETELPPTSDSEAQPMQGRLRAWASPESDLQFDVSKAEGIDDFVQVVCQDESNFASSNEWAALRANGTIVSSDGQGENLTNVVRLIPCCDYFGALTVDGRAFFYGIEGEIEVPCNQGERVIDAVFQDGYELAILDDYSLKCWGRKLDSAHWPPPPEEVLSSRIRRVQITKKAAHALTVDGRLFVWGQQGLFDIPEVLRTGIDEIEGNYIAGFTVRKGEKVYRYLILQEKLHSVEVSSDAPVSRLLTQARGSQVIEDMEGQIHVSGRSNALAAKLNQLPPHTSYAAATLGGAHEGIEKIEMLLYIEPTPLQGSLHAWMTTGEVPIDLSKAEGIDDFVQVISVRETWDGPSSYGWAALRSNGQVISSSGVGEELENVERLIESPAGFGVIFEDGSALVYGNRKEIYRWTGLPGEKAVDGAVVPTHGLCILEDGRLRHWGLRYDSGPIEERWPPPPPRYRTFRFEVWE